MGWTSSIYWKAKSDVVKEVTGANFWSDSHEIVDFKSTKSGCFILLNQQNKAGGSQSVIVCVLISKIGHNEFGYKCIEEGSYPYYFDCPVSIINKANKLSEAMGRGADWRNAVLDHHKEKAALKLRRSKLKPELVLSLWDTNYRLIESIPRRGWLVESLKDNQVYRMSNNQIDLAEILT
ncbi:hypothetical protein VNTUMSATTG_59060 (plasmid) [Vibrio nigripulchritudo]|uniref:hypothetical protein n=1 Tax=Vibrio nigripulchritudo TaxID=28173 RepID=UPI00190B04FE|nr:hypothetical protein [Vibrio nigripulchritudo]BCL73969.1 hypothetical protein VNTUMSATTG_59060 [Vibrio nigripulchritudo]